MSKLTDDEMKELAFEFKRSIDRANDIFELLKNVLTGSNTETFIIDGTEVGSISKQVNDTIQAAIDSGILEVPDGKIINEIYLNSSGELIVDYSDI